MHWVRNQKDPCRLGRKLVNHHTKRSGAIPLKTSGSGRTSSICAVRICNRRKQIYISPWHWGEECSIRAGVCTWGDPQQRATCWLYVMLRIMFNR